MKAVRVRVSSWTASFRYPGFMIGIQPTLPMPPLSTVYGLLSAAAGKIITPADTFVGYTFQSHGKTVDLERILELEPGKPGKWNVLKREVLFDNRLVLYLDPKMRRYFEHPYFPLLLGRSSDLVRVEQIDDVDLELLKKQEAPFGNSIFTDPPPGYRLATMYALPVYFTDSIPREAIGTQPFAMVTEKYTSVGTGVYDPEEDIAFPLHTAASLGLRTA
ncbi:MAG: type I-B CRISPR-associated protein Cas5b [Candidatus Thorarchaeota archaeon]